jgi:hypothetical protein
LIAIRAAWRIRSSRNWVLAVAAAVDLQTSSPSTIATACASVECPLGSEPWIGVWMIVWICGDSSCGRRTQSACLKFISAYFASRNTI